MPTTNLALTLPDARDAALAAEAGARLAPHLTDAALPLRLADGQELLLPARAAHLLRDLLAELAAGHAVALLPLPANLSIQQAADLLNVSRPYLIHLIESGRLPCHHTDRQRRIPLADVQAFQRQFEAEREGAMMELAQQAQALGMGY